MPDPIPPNIARLTRQYVDGRRFSSSDEVLLFAMNLFVEFERHYHDELGKLLKESCDAIDRGEGIDLFGGKEIEMYFNDMMEANRRQARSQAD